MSLLVKIQDVFKGKCQASAQGQSLLTGAHDLCAALQDLPALSCLRAAHLPRAQARCPRVVPLRLMTCTSELLFPFVCELAWALTVLPGGPGGAGWASAALWWPHRPLTPLQSPGPAAEPHRVL